MLRRQLRRQRLSDGQHRRIAHSRRGTPFLWITQVLTHLPLTHLVMQEFAAKPMDLYVHRRCGP
jgi:hypothetical protein